MLDTDERFDVVIVTMDSIRCALENVPNWVAAPYCDRFNSQSPNKLQVARRVPAGSISLVLGFLQAYPEDSPGSSGESSCQRAFACPVKSTGISENPLPSSF